ncbi:GNAT family N-acetyltransferase [Aneurinibacillus sp. Ricciae_BoGa-3]|uniref:GNAT family N-acetyltransferase n=1 Tax=Aneurinibacillus sp. Ricciae_BoGa-3 TaxID=3022697 RepID=UPI002341AA36|nr:GNAT family N-acetyltransferase [Aneurinibacillus sp. Ricciae_BoGa-3]WCK55103.1 GNAT family N-acetyltransferase [Aneurinibacillus sp. Ricciae_BoGa-3]
MPAINAQQWTRGDAFTISNDNRYLDVDMIFHFLSKESYWSQDIPVELVKKMIENSTVCFGVYERIPASDSLKQVGFARVVSDLVRFAWLADVFILPDYRGLGLSKWLMNIITEQPYLKGARFMLVTKDAQGLYAQFGFEIIENPENFMQRPYNTEVVIREHTQSTSK